MKLYEMTDRYQYLLDEITEATDDGVMFDRLTEELEQIEGDIYEKVESCAKMVRALDARAKAFKNEQKFFEAKAKSANASAEGLEAYMLAQMDKLGIEKVEGKTLTIKMCKNGQPSTIIIGEVPEEYQIPQEPKTNTTAIKEALLGGEELPFAQLNYGKHLRIS